MSNEIKAGPYRAKVIDYGIGATKKGEPQAVVMFRFADADGDSHDLTWFGYFSEKARPYTAKNLVTLGFKGDNPGALVKGKGSGVLDEMKEVEIVVGWDTYTNPETGEQKGRWRVNFINEIGASRFNNLMEANEVALKFQGMDFGADFAAARAEAKVSSAPVKNHAPTAGSPPADVGINTAENIPF